jgi:hypothetical protein
MKSRRPSFKTYQSFVGLQCSFEPPKIDSEENFLLKYVARSEAVTSRRKLTSQHFIWTVFTRSMFSDPQKDPIINGFPFDLSSFDWIEFGV